MAQLSVAGPIRLVLTVAALGLLGSGMGAAVNGSEAPTPTAAAASHYAIHGADAERTVAIEAALGRFDASGLELPPLEFHLHRTTDGCEGHLGLFNRDGSGSRIDLCTDVAAMILHEIAHAWEHHAVSDATRQEFLGITGLETWNDADTGWEERGIEAAAQVIAWGLMDIPITNPSRFSQQLRQFELLTGISSPRLAS